MRTALDVIETLAKDQYRRGQIDRATFIRRVAVNHASRSLDLNAPRCVCPACMEHRGVTS